jgi:hypothetical protein
MCLRAIGNLLILFLPFLITGIGMGFWLLQTAPRDPGHSFNDQWFAFFLGIVTSPLIIYVLIVYQSALIAIPFVLYYIIVFIYRKKWWYQWK